MKLGAAHQGERDRERTLGHADRLEVPGYRLLRRLEYGDVWIAEGPGGMLAQLRFLRNQALDAEPLRRARHPNVQTPLGSWRLGQTLVLAAEPPDRTLRDRHREALDSGIPAIPPMELIAVLAEAARGLDYLNGNPQSDALPALVSSPGVVHGSIRPASILYVGGGVKIAELDPSRWLSVDTPFSHSLPSKIHTPPEFLQGRSSRHSDQFSLAVAYAQLRLGQQHFDNPPDVHALHDPERAIVLRALSPLPSDRWPSCSAFIDALRSVLISPRSLGTPLPSPPRSPASAALTFAVATAAATLAGALWIASITSRRGVAARPEPRPLVDPNSTIARLPLPRVRLQTPEILAPSPAARPIVMPQGPEAFTPPDLLAAASISTPNLSNPQLKTTAPPPQHFEVVAPHLLTIELGKHAVFPVLVTTDALDGPVTIHVDDLPRGLHAADACEPPSEHLDPVSPAVASLRVEVVAEPNAAEGESYARLVVNAGSHRAETLVKLNVRPSPAIASRRQGDLALHRERYDDAIAAYTLAVELDSADDPAYHGRALAHYAKGDPLHAREDLDAALKIRPNVPTVLNNRGLAHFALGDNAAALADFDAAAALDPSYAVVRYNRGRVHAKAGQPEKAVNEYNDALRLDPKFAKAYKARGDALAKLGEPSLQRALIDYDAGLRLSPADTAALNNRGLLLFARGEIHRAIADFDEAIRVNPKYAVVRYNRGRAYAYLGDDVEALACFDQALKLDPTLAKARTARVELLARRKPTPP